jgi:cytochrome c553
MRSLACPPILWLLSSVFLSAAARAAGNEPGPAGAALFQNVCAACHGGKGQGSEPLKAPSIAGRPAWYVLRQLESFRAGFRGANATEPQATIMGAVAKTLNPSHLDSVAAFVESLAVVVPPAPSNSNPVRGKELFEERCMECHRYNATGEIVFGSPPLTGLPDWYLLAQLRKYKNGQRGAVPGDAFGAKMVLSSKFIDSEETLQSVVAYIVKLNPGPKPVKDAEALFVAPSHSAR